MRRCSMNQAMNLTLGGTVLLRSPNIRLPRKWEGEAPAEPWNSAKMGFDRSLTLPHKTRNAVESMFSSEAVSFLGGGFMGRLRSRWFPIETRDVTCPNLNSQHRTLSVPRSGALQVERWRLNVGRFPWLIGLLLGFAFTGIAAVSERPNIILAMADDMGWGDVGFNGNTIVRTPNLDSMARSGIRFERFTCKGG